VEVKYSPAGASIFVTSNIPTFEKIQAQTKWTLTDKKTHRRIANEEER
jgi:hypothetical protein